MTDDELIAAMDAERAARLAQLTPERRAAIARQGFTLVIATICSRDEVSYEAGLPGPWDS